MVTDSARSPKGYFKDVPLHFLKVWFSCSCAIMVSEIQVRSDSNQIAVKC